MSQEEDGKEEYRNDSHTPSVTTSVVVVVVYHGPGFTMSDGTFVYECHKQLFGNVMP